MNNGHLVATGDKLGESGEVLTGRTLTDNATLTGSDRVILMGTDAKLITLPSAVTYPFKVITLVNIAADGAAILDIAPATGEKINGNTANKKYRNTKATAIQGDCTTLWSNGVDGWWTVSERGIWAKEA